MWFFSEEKAFSRNPSSTPKQYLSWTIITKAFWDIISENFNPGISNSAVKRGEKAEILGSWHSVTQLWAGRFSKCWTVWQPAGPEAEFHKFQLNISPTESTYCTAVYTKACMNTSRLSACCFSSSAPPLLGGKQSGANRKHQKGYKYFSQISCQTHLVFSPETPSYCWILTDFDLW